jgi:hypothetical protein
VQDAPPAIVIPAPEVASADQGGIGPKLVVPEVGNCPSADSAEIVVCAPNRNEAYRLRPLSPLPPEPNAREKVIDALTVHIGPVVIAPGGACGTFGICIGFAGTSPKPAKTISLVCLGSGSASRLEPTIGNIAGETVNSIGRREVPYDDQVNIELVEGKESRIRLPRAMLPTIRGWKGGWFKLSEIQVKTDEIMATNEMMATANISDLAGAGVRLEVRLDWLQDMISVSGKSGEYSGTCKPFEPVA